MCDACAVGRYQPVSGAACLGLLDILTDFGVHSDAFAGHSFGELVALFAGGAYNPTALLKLAIRRGECMASTCEDDGGMLAVATAVDEVQRILEAEGVTLTVANHNAPSQGVLTGTVIAIDVQVSWIHSSTKLSPT